MNHSELQMNIICEMQWPSLFTCWRILINDSRILMFGRLLSGRGLNQSYERTISSLKQLEEVQLL